MTTRKNRPKGRFFENYINCVRAAIPRKKPLTFGHCPKGGGEGFNPNPKVLGVVFLGLSFGHFPKKGGGLNPFQKFWGSFEVVFRYFFGLSEVVFGGMFFSKSA